MLDRDFWCQTVRLRLCLVLQRGSEAASEIGDIAPAIEIGRRAPRQEGKIEWKRLAGMRERWTVLGPCMHMLLCPSAVCAQFLTIERMLSGADVAQKNTHRVMQRRIIGC